MSLLTGKIISMIALLGKLIGRLLPVKNSSGLFFFFPFYHTGGAEKVHADIVNCFKGQRPWVFFAKRSSDDMFKKQFHAAALCFDMPLLLKYTYPLSAGILAGLIGRHREPKVFGCNSLFFYLLLPHLPAHVRATDLVHGLGGEVERFALPVVDKLAQRVLIAAGVKRQMLEFYRAKGVSPDLDNRLVVISNRTKVPEHMAEKPVNGTLELLFVGRGSEEKRVHLIARAARLISEQGVEARFRLIGDLADSVDEIDKPYCCLLGAVSDEKLLEQYYRQSQIILITSSREGFPLTVMEGMAQGCVPVCTAVGGILDHIRHGENGWLLPADDEDAVVRALCDAVAKLAGDRQLLVNLSGAAFSYARDNFSGERFCEGYRLVIMGEGCR